jgi:hypothetical protein
MSATQSPTIGNPESSTYGTGAVTQRRSRATNRSLYRQSLAFDEALLIERLKAGDSEALETIFNTYSKTLYKVALRILGEVADTQEVIQDVFWTAFRKAQSFRGNSRFSTWLYRLTVNARRWARSVGARIIRKLDMQSSCPNLEKTAIIGSAPYSIGRRPRKISTLDARCWHCSVARCKN